MFLNRLAYRIPFGRHAFRTGIRSASTVVGKSGRVYTENGVAFKRDNINSHLGVFGAKSGNEPFVLKRTTNKLFYDAATRLADDIPESHLLRLHVDHNEEENVLVYPYFNNDLRSLIEEDAYLHPRQLMKIMRNVAKAVRQLHSNDWNHNDITPNNILVDWTCYEKGEKTIIDAVLGDFDYSIKYPPTAVTFDATRPLGDFLWRSPEGQVAKGMSKASDIYSLGLTFIYTLGGWNTLRTPEPADDFPMEHYSPTGEVLLRQFCLFGQDPDRLVPDGLLERIHDETARDIFKEVSKEAERVLKENPEMSFQRCAEFLGPEGLNMLSGMTYLDPKDRLTIDQVLEHPWWDTGMEYLVRACTRVPCMEVSEDIAM